MSAREYVLNIARPRPVRRAAVIVSMLALLGAVLLVWFEDHLSGSIGTELAYVAAVALALAGFILVDVTVRAQRAGSDERHVAVRDAAYRQAYRMLAVTAVVLLFVVSVAWESGVFDFTLQPRHLRALLLAVAGAAVWLPASVLAWREREV